MKKQSNITPATGGDVYRFNLSGHPHGYLSYLSLGQLRLLAASSTLIILCASFGLTRTPLNVDGRYTVSQDGTSVVVNWFHQPFLATESLYVLVGVMWLGTVVTCFLLRKLPGYRKFVVLTALLVCVLAYTVTILAPPEMKETNRSVTDAVLLVDGGEKLKEEGLQGLNQSELVFLLTEKKLYMEKGDLLVKYEIVENTPERMQVVEETVNVTEQ